MSSFAALQDPPLHLLLTVSLALVATIPNATTRYSALVLVAILTLFCTIQLKSPSAQLHQLAALINETDVLLRRTMTQCPRDHIALTEQMSRLLEANKISSQIKCRILTAEGVWWLSWNNYRIFSKSIMACAKSVKAIHIEIQLTMEGEIQRKIGYDAAEVQFILATGTASNSALRYRAYRRVIKGCLVPISQPAYSV